MIGTKKVLVALLILAMVLAIETAKAGKPDNRGLGSNRDSGFGHERGFRDRSRETSPPRGSKGSPDLRNWRGFKQG